MRSSLNTTFILRGTGVAISFVWYNVRFIFAYSEIDENFRCGLFSSTSELSLNLNCLQAEMLSQSLLGLV